MLKSRLPAVLLGACALLVLMADVCPGQQQYPYFGIDFQGRTFGTPDPTGVPIWASEILVPSRGVPFPGPLAPPLVFWPGGPGGAAGVGLGIFTWPMPAEVDAISWGHDAPNGCFCGFWHFSVDEFAMGLPGVGAPPDVFSEGSVGWMEASADIFSGIMALAHPAVPPNPPAPLGPPMPNQDIIDGNGLPPAGVLGSGVGLIEPNPPTPGILPDPGDNLDALEMDPLPQLPVMPVAFFSLDSGFPDWLEAPPANTGSAVANGFVGGDVLMSVWGGPPVLYAPAPMLGLDLMGPDTDDLDALALEDWGDGVYIPGHDLIAFSVRRGSAVIGAPDSRWGAPISEADILEPPLPAGVSPFPAILVPGEAIGLNTMRMGPPGPYEYDDLDALDVTRWWGDTDGDGDDDIFDVITVIVAFGSVPGAANWTPFADLDCSGLVDIFDVIDAINNFGTTW